MSDEPLDDLKPLEPVTRGDVARGAGLAGLARSGAIIEAVTQPLYVWMFGLSTYGLYVVLWGAVNLSTNVLDVSLPNALQRVVPTRDSEVLAHGAVKFAMLVTLALTTLLAALVSLNAEAVASLVHADAVDSARVPGAIAVFVWALPIWTFVEISTAAVRARRAFGPEIRLRIFWEQIARLAFAVGFFALGERSTGLMAAHLCSLVLMALLCVPLLRRFYDLRLLVTAPIPGTLVRETLATGLSLLPSNISRRMLIDGPPLMINLIIAGPGAAAAAGLFEIARKLSTVTYIVRQSFQYVLAPLSSAQARADRGSIGPLYHFSTRVSTALVVPLAGLIVFSGRDLLSVYRPEAMAALSLLPILCAARAGEAIVGPAGTIVEMIGHRGLPLFNSAIAFLLWFGLSVWLTPQLGAMGMAIAVSVAIVASTYIAVIELQVSDGLSPFDYKLWQGLGLALAGVAAMWVAASTLGGPLRFSANVALWAGTSWLTLRYGLTREDRLALGGVSRKLGLV